MVEELKVKCPRINLFVLCFEYGKFDSGIQDMIENYSKLLNDKSKMWKSMIAVVTKVSWNEDHETLDEWV